jgi:hypothetical protein
MVEGREGRRKGRKEGGREGRRKGRKEEGKEGE